MAGKAGGVRKRRSFRLWAVTIAWLIAARIAVTAVFAIGVGIYAFSLHMHDHAAAHAMGAQIGLKAVPVLLAVNWGLRLGIVYLAREGLLPGTGARTEAEAAVAPPVARVAPEPRVAVAAAVVAAPVAMPEAAARFGLGRRPALAGGAKQAAAADYDPERMLRRLRRESTAA